MLVTRIVLLASVVFGALVVFEPTSAALPSHDTRHHSYNGNVNVPYGPGPVLKSDAAYVVSGRTMRCNWRKGCSEVSSP